MFLSYKEFTSLKTYREFWKEPMSGCKCIDGNIWVHHYISCLQCLHSLLLSASTVSTGKDILVSKYTSKSSNPLYSTRASYLSLFSRIKKSFTGNATEIFHEADISNLTVKKWVVLSRPRARAGKYFFLWRISKTFPSDTRQYVLEIFWFYWAM